MIFYRNAFSSKNLKEVWKIINTVLHPPPQRIQSDPNKLNAHFSTTAQCIINSFISSREFPSEWKTSRVCMIPKIANPLKNDDYRPINILPVFSKVFEKIVLQQIVSHVESHHIYKDTIAGFRKGYSTASALLNLRDNIRKAMNAQEVTLITMIDFSKAFETVDSAVIIKKLHTQGFSKSFLHWTLSYLSNRKQFTQIDDKKSSELPVYFGVPQGSILGPVLFNLYVNDLSDCFSSSSIQYADDTTIYESAKPKNIDCIVTNINTSLHNINEWSTTNCLAINQGKTKFMLLGTSQLLQRHENLLNVVKLQLGDSTVEETKCTKLLGVEFDSHLKWNDHVKNILTSGYAKLSTLRKMKNFTPLKLRKRLIETLIFSKIDFNDHIYTPLTCVQIKKLQRLQLSSASFVLGRYAKMHDLKSLEWLPISERREFNMLKLTFKAMHTNTWPVINQLKRKRYGRELRNNDTKLEHSLITGTFQDTTSQYFNDLPSELRNLTSFPQFCKDVKRFLFNRRFNN